MYGNEPAAWSPKLGRTDRRRFTINALTRMRYCDRRGRLDLRYSGPPGSQPKGLSPWFDAPDRRAANVHIVFGHWAALGLLRRADVTALDTGCAWGNRLTAVRLDGPGEVLRGPGTQCVHPGELGTGPADGVSFPAHEQQASRGTAAAGGFADGPAG